MGKNILLVEDNSDHHFILKAHLEAADYQVFSADNGLKALKIVSKEKIDLMILDLWLPKLDGFSFLQSIRAHPEWANIPVIITTGVERPKDILELAGLEVGSCFTKPYEPHQVVQAVESLLLSPQNG